MQMKIKKSTNELQSICVKTNLNKASIVVLVRGGSVYENEENNGIFHLIEHSIFNGSQKYPTSKEVEDKLNALGIIENEVLTNKEFTKYCFSFHTKDSKKALAFIAEIITNPIFSDKYIESEKSIILEEERLTLNDNYHVFDTKASKVLFKGSPLLLDPIGTKETLEKLNSKVAKEIYKKYYNKSNMVIVYVGKESTKEMSEEIKKAFKHIPNGIKMKYPEFNLNKNNGKNIFKSPNDFNFCSITYYFSFSSRKDKDLLQILRGVLSEKIRQSLIFNKKLSYDAQVESLEFETIGLLDINSSFNKGNKVKVLKLLEEEVSKLTITEKEFSYAKSYILNELDFTLDDSVELSNYLAFNLIGNDKFRSPQQEKKDLQKITLSDLKNFVKKVLAKENLTMFVSGDKYYNKVMD